MGKDVEIRMTKEVNLKGYTLIEGFPGIGLIGTIAVGFLSEKKGVEHVGFILSKHFPPMASIHKGAPVFPARVYVSKKEKLVLIFSEFVVPANIVYDISTSILEWSKANGIKQIISLAGMTSRNVESDEPHVYGIASDEKIAKDLDKHDVKLVTEGVTTGVSGILLAQCNMENFPAMSLLVETTHGYPDPGAAAVLLEKLEEVTGIDIDTDALLKEAKEIEGKMKKMMEQMKVGKIKYQQAEEQSPMYG
ncbi:MAG: proteasome assembly chaperone family protein [Candidatus Diapherotrites archaeon]|nr:proteasome assembly chaperone family protein [Candidatus Diapherotrites archaeon]